MVHSGSVPIAHVGPVAGAAWRTSEGPAIEVHIVGKLMIQLGREGKTSMLMMPELPGWNQGRAAREEIDVAPARQLIVRGHRTQPGRVVLRRGETTLGEIRFGPGVEPVATSLPSTMQTTIGSRRGDDWLVVEGVEDAHARRWCKLPKLGVLVTWDDVERLLLASRACIVDVSSWTISFLLRGSRKFLASMVPQRLTLTMLDLAENEVAAAIGALSSTARSERGGSTKPLQAVPAPPPRASSSPMIPVIPPPPLEEEESSSAGGGHTRQVNADELAKLLAGVQSSRRGPLEDGSDDGPTKILPNVDLMRLRNESQDAPAPGPDASVEPPDDGPETAIPPPRVPDADVDDLDGATRAFFNPPPLEPDPEPGDVTRAFNALTGPAAAILFPLPPPSRPGGTDMKSEIERRVQSGTSLAGLDLRRTLLGSLRAAGAKMADLDLSEADLESADLTGADLSRAKLDGAKLDGAKLDRARLGYATFECASLRGASLRGADLTGASFAAADLQDADVRGAQPMDALVGANLDGAKR